MSGFEVAGITLAVFPIVVNGLTQFTEGIQTIKHWRRYRIQLAQYAQILGNHHVFYRETLTQLLIDIVPSDEDLALMEDPEAAIWKKREYDRRLHERLDGSYDSYLENMQTMVKALREISKELGIDQTSGKVLWNDYSTLERQIKRFKLTLSKTIYKERLEVIDRANKTLREYTHQNILLEPARLKRRSKRALTDLKLIRRHAVSLYKVFITGNAWKCSCKKFHMASLRLEPRPQTLEGTKADVPKEYKFRILLSTSREAKKDVTKSQWQEIEVVPSLETQSQAGGPEDAKRSQSPSQRNVKGVKFDLNTSSTSPVKPLSGAAPTDTCDFIADICSTLRASQDLRKVLGFLVDEADEKHKHYLYRADTVISSDTHSESLGDLLRSSQYELPTGFLSRKVRLQIAVTLASSVLQLDGSSWLKSKWTSKDIFFHQQKIQAADESYSHPYLSWKFCAADTEAPCPLGTLTIGNQLIRSEVLFALGLTLIELCFGKTLEEMQKPMDGISDEPNTRVNTAHRLLHSVYNEMGPPYGDVVRRCLFQPFDVREMSLDNEEVQQAIIENIVTPLVQDFKSFNGCLEIP